MTTQYTAIDCQGQAISNESHNCVILKDLAFLINQEYEKDEQIQNSNRQVN